MGCAAAGRGVLQFVSDFTDPEREFAHAAPAGRAQSGGRCRSRSLQSLRAPEQWQLLLDRLAAATQQGLPMKAQVCGRPVGVLFGLELTLNPFSHHPSYREIGKLPLAERVARLRDPEFRARLLGEESRARGGFSASMPRNWPMLYLMSDPPDYEQPPSQSVAALAKARGITPEALALDHLLDWRWPRHAVPAVPELRERQPRPELRDAARTATRCPGSRTAARTSG